MVPFFADVGEQSSSAMSTGAHRMKRRRELSEEQRAEVLQYATGISVGTGTTMQR